MFYVTQPTDQQLYSEVKVEVNGNLTLVDKKKKKLFEKSRQWKAPPYLWKSCCKTKSLPFVFSCLWPQCFLNIANKSPA